MKANFLPAVLALCAAFTAGCSSYGPPKVQPGDDVAQLIPVMGPPTGRYDLPDGGARVEYARGPYGKHTWMIDVDRDNRVVAVQQVLTEENFNSIKTPVSAQELLLKLGRPSEKRPGGFQGGQVWSWRYESVFCQWFQASVNDEGSAWDVAYGPDPLCEDRLDDYGP